MIGVVNCVLCRQEDIVKKLAIAIAVFALGVMVVIGLGLFLRYLVLNSGPFSDAQVQSRAAVPIENIRVSMAGRLSILWKVDDRFELECGDDITIKKGTKISDFPDFWRVKDYTGELGTIYGSHLFDVDNASGERDPFMFVETNDDQEVVGVRVYSRGRRGVRFLDLQSSIRISLYHATFEELDASFRSLPQ